MSVVTQKGQVTIPKEIRNKLNVKHGDEVVFDVEDEKVILRKKGKNTRFHQYIGYLKPKTDTKVDDIVHQLREGGE